MEKGHDKDQPDDPGKRSPRSQGSALWRRPWSAISVLISSLITSFSKEGNHGEKDAVQSSMQLTSSLRTAVQMMSTEVEKSRAAAQALHASTATLASANRLHSAYQGVLQQSSKIVKRMRQREWLDRWLIYLALLFFCAVVARIVWRRMWIPFYDRRGVEPPAYDGYNDEF